MDDEQTEPTQIDSSTRNERAATLVEYVLMISLIALACVVSMKYLGQSVNTGISTSNSSMFGP
jgi:Flp pilus assembly pilin Flp